MKRLLILILLLSVLGIHAHAKRIEGYFVNSTGEHKVTFLIPISFADNEPDYLRLQSKVMYLDASDKKVAIKASEASEIRFKYHDKNICLRSRTYATTYGVNLGYPPKYHTIFLRLIIDGTLKAFIYYERGRGGVYQYVIFQKKQEKMFEVPYKLSFRKPMAEYFSDCPELAAKIENKELLNTNLKEIVLFYNEHCGL